MRTSGRESDLFIFMLPLGGLVMLGLWMFGAPADILRTLDRTVMEAVYWVAKQLS